MHIRIAAVLGFLGVALGAFGAHGFKSILEANHSTAWWDTAVLYHLVHAVVLLIVAQFPQARLAALARGAFLVGIILFSGSLYIRALGGPKWMGMIAPLGGLGLMIGWVSLIIGGLKRSDEK